MNVKFYFGSQAKYDALLEKNPMALYFIEDTQRLYKGDVLLATGADATSMSSGLMSAQDKIKLDTLVGGISNLTPVDDTIVIVNKEDGSKSIGVAVSKVEGNLIAVKDDGLFVKVDPVMLEDVVGLKDRLEAIEKASVGGIHYRGSVETEADLPANASQGDLYEVLEDHSEWCFNGTEWFKYGNTNGFTPVAGDGISIVDSTITVKIAEDHHGLVAVDGALALALATTESDGAMSKEDKVFIASIPSTYASKEFVQNTAKQVKYEITSVPVGTLVNYREDEIRIMCPSDAKWTKQTVGNGGDPNSYYATFKTYVPSDDIVGYIEHLGDQVDNEILTTFSTDEYGRRYQPTWLALAKYDEANNAWSYYGDGSTANKYLGWDYQIDWYNANGVMVSTDSIRINLSNANCHNAVVPYYMNNYATVEQIATMEEVYSWGEL